MDNFEERIAPNTDINELSRIICESFNLGNYVSKELINIGYEDYNFILATENGKYCVKIMSKMRSQEEIINYVSRIDAVSKSEVSSPKPLRVNDKVLHTINLGAEKYDIVVFEYINGKNYYQLETTPSIEELKKLADEVAKIHSIRLKPNFIYDSWAIINFEKEYNDKFQYLEETEKTEVESLLDSYRLIDFSKLPVAFVHGDVISTNLMKDQNDKLWIIDYAVSNYLPRITDLVIVACNLCLDKNSKENTVKNIQTFLQEYEIHNPLTKYENEVFDILYKVANAMHILQTQFLSKNEGQSDENDYWYTEGKIGLSYGNIL